MLAFLFPRLPIVESLDRWDIMKPAKNRRQPTRLLVAAYLSIRLKYPSHADSLYVLLIYLQRTNSQTS